MDSNARYGELRKKRLRLSLKIIAHEVSVVKFGVEEDVLSGFDFAVFLFNPVYFRSNAHFDFWLFEKSEFVFFCLVNRFSSEIF